jgi:hypothetical protein
VSGRIENKWRKKRKWKCRASIGPSSLVLVRVEER